jgi:hypothetical protein
MTPTLRIQRPENISHLAYSRTAHTRRRHIVPRIRSPSLLNPDFNKATIEEGPSPMIKRWISKVPSNGSEVLDGLGSQRLEQRTIYVWIVRTGVGVVVHPDGEHR